MKNLPTRKRIRLKEYDYSQNGLYYVTICAEHKKNIFGSIAKGGIFDYPYTRLSKSGWIVYNQINEINQIYENKFISDFTIMPNHIHLIICINNEIVSGSSGTPPPTNSGLSSFVSAFKRFSNKKSGFNLWQRGYYDHIIRDENDYLRVLKYIEENPFEKE